MRPAGPSGFALLALAGILASPLAAQLQVPGLPVPAPGVRGVVEGVTGPLDETLDTLEQTAVREARRLLRLREQMIDRLVARNPEAIERDALGNPARRGELLVTDPSQEALSALEQAGFAVAGREKLEGLDIEVVRLAVPPSLSLAQAQKLAAKVAPQVEASPDHLHFTAGTIERAPAVTGVTAIALQGAAVPVAGMSVGVIDGGAGAAVAVSAQKGFAKGAPVASDHGTAVAGLLRSAGVRRIRVADVYGNDPAGGNALAVARALGWLVSSDSKVVTISLVGPRNLVVERAINAALARSVVVVAAVGNDGPAAPPAYPASYEGVLAITGVDRRGRALIEAGRALHLDYAAPGAGVHAPDGQGRTKAWRGTSFAAPLAAARIVNAIEGRGDWRKRLDAEARDLGKKGPDKTFGRGLLCGDCGRKR